MTVDEMRLRLAEYRIHEKRLGEEGHVLSARLKALPPGAPQEERLAAEQAVNANCNERANVSRKIEQIEKPEVQRAGIRRMGPGQLPKHDQEIRLNEAAFRRGQAEPFDSTEAREYYRVTGPGGSEQGEWWLTEESYASFVSPDGGLDESKFRARAAVPDSFQHGKLEVHVMATGPGDRVHGFRGQVGHQHVSARTGEHGTAAERIARNERNEKASWIGGNDQLQVRGQYQSINTYHVGTAEEKAMGRGVRARQPHAGKGFAGPVEPKLTPEQQRRRDRLNQIPPGSRKVTIMDPKTRPKKP